MSQGQETDSRQETDQRSHNLLPNFEQERANTGKSHQDHHKSELQHKNEKAFGHKFQGLMRNSEMSNYPASDMKYNSTNNTDRNKNTLQPAKSTMIRTFDRFKSNANQTITGGKDAKPKASNDPQLYPYQAPPAPAQPSYFAARSKSILTLKSENTLNLRKRSQYKSPYKMK